MDWSPQTNYHRTHYEALDIPNLAESSLSVTSLLHKETKTNEGSRSVYIIKMLTHMRRTHLLSWESIVQAVE